MELKVEPILRGTTVRLVRVDNLISVYVDKMYKDESKNTTELLAVIEYKPNRARKKYIVKERAINSPYKYGEYTYARDILRHPSFRIHLMRAVNSKPGNMGRYSTSFEYMNYTPDIHGLQDIMDDIETIENIELLVNDKNVKIGLIEK